MQILPQSLEHLGVPLGGFPIVILEGRAHRLAGHPRAVPLRRGLGHQAVPSVAVLIGLGVREREQLLEGTRCGRSVDVLGRWELERLAAAHLPPAHAPAPSPATTATRRAIPAGGTVAAGALGGDNRSRSEHRGQKCNAAEPHGEGSLVR